MPPNEPEQKRTRTALIVFLLGILLLLWALGTLVFRTSLKHSLQVDPVQPTAQTIETRSAVPSHPENQPPDNERASRKFRLLRATTVVVVVGLSLLVLFFFGSYLLIRSSRRHQARLNHDRPPSTQCDDLWAKHKLPDAAQQPTDGGTE